MFTIKRRRKTEYQPNLNLDGKSDTKNQKSHSIFFTNAFVNDGYGHIRCRYRLHVQGNSACYLFDFLLNVHLVPDHGSSTFTLNVGKHINQR
jgi:hypothetical protein